ncbi:MAG: hypothetical protein JO001_00255 [Alphaproteobacteria bacterium]|nr:hypothetical protein [Alphaproteobacteria bacterium]
MTSADLNRLETEAQEARQRLRSGLEALRAPGTLESFKDEVTNEAKKSYNDAIAHGTANATTWSERLVADIKERAAANPVAVGAIAAGIGWRIIRKPPITTMLVGYGLYSLYRTKPGELAPGAQAVYKAADAAVMAKENVGQWSRDAGDAVGQARDKVVPALADAVQRLSAQSSEFMQQATQSVHALAEGGTERFRQLSTGLGSAIEQASNSAGSLVTSGSERISYVVQDKEERDRWLLGAAAGALTVAMALAWLKRTN